MPGSGSATHSPQPSASSVSTRSQHADLLGLVAEARPERPDERHAHQAQLDRPDPASSVAPRSARTPSRSVKPATIKPGVEARARTHRASASRQRVRQRRIAGSGGPRYSRGIRTAPAGPAAGAPPRGRVARGSPSAPEHRRQAAGRGRGPGSRSRSQRTTSGRCGPRAFERVGHLAVEVAAEPVRHRAQLRQVEPGVARDQRIERPADHVRSPAPGTARAARASARTPRPRCRRSGSAASMCEWTWRPSSAVDARPAQDEADHALAVEGARTARSRCRARARDHLARQQLVLAPGGDHHVAGSRSASSSGRERPQLPRRPPRAAWSAALPGSSMRRSLAPSAANAESPCARTGSRRRARVARTGDSAAGGRRELLPLDVVEIARPGAAS